MQVGSLVTVKGIIYDWSISRCVLGLVIGIEPKFYKKPGSGRRARVTVYWDTTEVSQEPESYLEVISSVGDKQCTQHKNTI